MKHKKHSLHILPIFLFGLLVGLSLRNPIEQSIHLNAYQIEAHEPFNNAKFDALPQVGQIIERDGYTLCYDARSKNPHYVVEVLTAESLEGSADRSTHLFREDENIPRHLRASSQDYKGSGYDRGHMVPAANCRKSVKRMAESFFLSNVCPRDAGLNRGYWLAFERHIRDLTRYYDTVQVITGPLYLPQGEPGARFVRYPVIGPKDVAVPTHFFKVLRLEQGSDVEELAYIMPNEHIAPETPLDAFQATVHKVEQMSGIVFNH